MSTFESLSLTAVPRIVEGHLVVGEGVSSGAIAVVDLQLAQSLDDRAL